MENNVKRFEKLLTTDKTALLIIDIQERIIRVINEYETVVEYITGNTRYSTFF